MTSNRFYTDQQWARAVEKEWSELQDVHVIHARKVREYRNAPSATKRWFIGEQELLRNHYKQIYENKKD